MRDARQQSVAAATSAEPEIERLAREVAELRAENAANRTELEAVRAHVMSRHAGLDSGDAVGQRDGPSKRRLGGRRPTSTGESSRASGLVSRRRLFGLVGGAAAVGTGLAVAGSTLTADPAAATGNMMIDGSNTGAGTTDLSSTTTGNAMTVEATGTNGSAFSATGNAAGHGVEGVSTSGTGVFGVSTSNAGVAGSSFSGIAVQASSATGAGLLLADNGVTMPPTSGSWIVGSFVVSGGQLWFCSASGTGVSARFVRISPLVPVNPPARVYDSRTGGGPLSVGQSRDITVTGTFGSSTIPTGVSAILCNLACGEPVGAGFLAMYQQGTSNPGTANVNFNNGQDISNNATSAVSAGMPGKVTVYCGNGSTQVIIDVFGYYP